MLLRGISNYLKCSLIFIIRGGHLIMPWLFKRLSPSSSSFSEEALGVSQWKEHNERYTLIDSSAKFLLGHELDILSPDCPWAASFTGKRATSESPIYDLDHYSHHILYSKLVCPSQIWGLEEANTSGRCFLAAHADLRCPLGSSLRIRWAVS